MAAPSPAPLVTPPHTGPLLPLGGQPLGEADLLRGHPLHRRVRVALSRPGPGGETEVDIRPVLPTDADAIVRFVAALSPESRYRRFHGALQRLSSAHLAGIVDVDHHDRETLVVLSPARRRGPLVAFGQYVRLDAGDAELALVVADEWQGRGVGRALVAALARSAAEAGIVRLLASVLADNAPANALMGGAGERSTVTPRGRTNEFVLDLVGAPLPHPLPARVAAPA